MNPVLSYARFLATLLVVLTLCDSLSAALSPTTQASRYAHLQEVNARWLYEASPHELLEEVYYNNEAERITDHLLRVVEILEKRDLSSLTAQQILNRKEALSLLRAYAKTGQFPINAFHNQRTPYFVDELGTHCAVGHLMRETGFTATVNTIRTETNYGYVLKELSKYPIITDWGVAHGFTKEELAWIQPDYTSLWFKARAFGTNSGVRGGTISDAKSDGLGVYIAGSFTEVDGIQANGLAYIQGESVEEVTQPFPFVKSLYYDTLSSRLYAHGLNLSANESAIFTIDESRTVSPLTISVTRSDSILFEGTSQGVAILQQSRDTTTQAKLYHHTLANGLASIASHIDWQGTVYDIKTWGDSLGIGGNYVAYQNGLPVDSNCTYLSLNADTLLPDRDAIETYIGRFQFDTIPGSPIILNFLEANSDNYIGYTLSITPGGDTLGIELYREGIFEAFGFGPITTLPTPWSLPSIIPYATTHNDFNLLVSGKHKQGPWVADSINSAIFWHSSVSMVGQSIYCNGRVMATPRYGDSLLIVGNFDELSGQPIKDIGIAESRISDSQEPISKKDYRCYISNSEIVVSFTNALPQNATLHLYSIDGRHVRENTLPAGQTEFRVPATNQKIVGYAIQTVDGVAAGILVSQN